MSSIKNRVVSWSCLLLMTVLPLKLAGRGGLTGPMSGLVFDSGTQSIRPILGVPGAAHLGAAVASGLDWAAVAPNGRAALGLSGGRLYLLRVAASGIEWNQLSEEAALPAKAAWSAASDAAAVYWAETGRLQIWRELTSAPSAAEPVDLSILQGEVSALALGNLGRSAVVGVTSSPGNGLYVVAAGNTPRLQVPLANPAAIILVRQDRDLFVADAASKQVLEVVDVEGAATVTPVANEASGIAEPAGLALSRDGKKLFVADKAGNSLSVFDLDSRSLAARFDLEFSPAFLQPLSDQGLFLMKAGSEGTEPYQVLDGALEPAVYFIPAGPISGEEE